jgi:hypothetical protein
LDGDDELITPDHTGPARIVNAVPELSSAHSLENALRDLTDRLRALPESRLVRQVGPAQDLAQRLVEWAHGVEHRGVIPPSAAPELPVVGIFVTADQVAVAGADLVAVLAQVSAPEVLAAAAAAVAELRAQL